MTINDELSVAWLLRVAERVPGDPQVDDLGPLFAGVARPTARAMEHDVYDSDILKAAALLHTLARLPCLEHSNLSFAWACTAALLGYAGHPLTYQPKDAAALAADAAANKMGVKEIAATLRGWTTKRS